MQTFMILSRERRIVEEDFETREAAEARLSELVADDPTLEGALAVASTGLPTAA